MSKKRASGAGRSKLGGVPLSRLQYPCRVTSCDESFRSDALKTHYINQVKFNTEGSPLDSDSEEFQKLSKKIQDHTRFFSENGYSLKNLPTTGKPVGVKNSVVGYFPPVGDQSNKVPGDDMDKLNEKRPRLDSENTDRTSGLMEGGDVMDSNTSVEKAAQDDEEMDKELDTMLNREMNILNNLEQNMSDEPPPSLEIREIVDNSVDIENNNKQDANGYNVGDENRTSSALTNYSEDRLAEKISEKLLLKLGIRPDQSLKNVIADAVEESVGLEKTVAERDKNSDWLESEDYFTCEICTILSTLSNHDLPSHLRLMRKGNFGTVSKGQAKFHWRKAIILHEGNPLHMWCQEKRKEVAEDISKEKNENLKAATLVATNAALCFKTFGSAKDFVRLNDKDNLTEGVLPAFKNDGGQEFFSYRELFFLKLSESIKEYFAEHVHSFSVTLDKVTDQRISYTVIITYFFCDGRIYFLLNSVQKMKSDDYDSNETAQMVARVLMETLGLGLEALKTRLHHFTYDGVYCSSEERFQGGGGLSLSDNVARVLGLQPGDISGNHDMSHNLQLAYTDVFKHERTGDAKIKKMIEEVYSVMADYNTGQAGTVFQEAAMNMNYVVLVNKSRQKTRFVRSDMRGMQTYMTNLPTIYGIQGEVLQECLRNNDNTGAKAARQYVEKLRNGTTLATILGYCQFLELYCECSLVSQHARKFPTTIIQASMKLESELEHLVENWAWEEESLKFGGFGSPRMIIEDLLSGVYRPYIARSSAVRNAVNQNIYRSELLRHQENLLATGVSEAELQELLNWDPPMAPQRPSCDSGEVPVVGFTVARLSEVEQHLRKLAKSLHTQLCGRIKMWPLLLSSVEGFGGDLAWVEEGEPDFNQHSREKLAAILDDLTGPARDIYHMELCLPAYQVFLKFARDMIKRKKAGLEEIWKEFWSRYHSNDMYEDFIQLFQHIQIKSYSEAICETVGSVMNIHHGRGRNVHPVNFNKEIYLQVNLPPLHIMKKKLIPEVVKHKLDNERKEFLSKTMRKSKLKFGNLSSTVGNFRVQEEEASHLPVSLFDLP